MGDVSEAAQTVADKGRDAARTIESSPAYQVLVRAGLVACGIVHLIVAWLAGRLALGVRGGGEEASNTGALRSLAEAPLGAGLLWVAAIGFFALVVWQAISALIGFREFDGFKRVRRRLASGLRTLLYGYLGVAAARIAAGPEADEGETAQESISEGLLGLPFGQVLVALVGAAVIAYGVTQVVRAFTQSFNDPALDADARKAGGLDQALQQVLHQPFGTWLLVALTLGIGAYGLYCFFWARHPKHA